MKTLYPLTNTAPSSHIPQPISHLWEWTMKKSRLCIYEMNSFRFLRSVGSCRICPFVTTYFTFHNINVLHVHSCHCKWQTFLFLRLNNISLCVCIYIGMYLTCILLRFWYILDTGAHQICVLYFLIQLIVFTLNLTVCVRRGGKREESDWKFLVCFCQCIAVAQNPEDTKIVSDEKCPFLLRPHHFPSSGSRFPLPRSNQVYQFLEKLSGQ